jgi:hypothetical protein
VTRVPRRLGQVPGFCGDPRYMTQRELEISRDLEEAALDELLDDDQDAEDAP